MKINKLYEGVDDSKLSPQDKQVVKKVLDATGGDMVAAAAVGQAKIAERSSSTANTELKESKDMSELPDDFCRQHGYMIGRVPYTWIEKDALDILEYVKAPANFSKYIKDGSFSISFQDIWDGAEDKLKYSDKNALHVAEALEKFFIDNGIPVEDDIEEEPEEAEISISNPKSRKRKSLFSLQTEDLTEEVNFIDDNNDNVLEVTDVITLDAVPEEVAQIEEPDCVSTTANKVMSAYQNANKWLDIVKEFVYYDLSCVFFSSFIHQLAHTMPGRFDKFGDILHTLNVKIPYPATEYIPQEPQNIDDVFNIVFMILDSIKASLNEFIKCTDEDNHGAACAAETLLNDIESEYPMWYRLRSEWEQCAGDTIKFDKYVNQYVKNKDDLLESLQSSQCEDVDTTSCKQELCRNLTDADEYVIDSAIDYIEENNICDPDDIRDCVMNLCKNCDIAQFNCEPDFDKCSDFVTVLVSEGCNGDK